MMMMMVNSPVEWLTDDSAFSFFSQYEILSNISINLKPDIRRTVCQPVQNLIFEYGKWICAIIIITSWQ